MLTKINHAILDAKFRERIRCIEGIRNSVFEAYLEKEEICRRTEGMRKKGCKAG